MFSKLKVGVKENMMDATRVRSKLPLVMAKGQPANLHEMSLTQLRKFVTFLVSSVAKCDIPERIEANAVQPPWWPTDILFCKETLTERLPTEELIQRLVKIVAACYSFHRSSYIIAFSSSLSSCKLEFVELRNGTCRILSNKGQHIVAIRTSTRHYDDDSLPRKQKQCDLLDSSSIAATDFQETFSLSPVLIRIDDPGLPQSTKVLRARRSLNRKVVDDITNQIKSESQVEVRKASVIKTAKGKAIKKPAPKGKGKKRRRNGVVKSIELVETVCKYCANAFSDQYLALEHEDVCQKIPPRNVEDIRDIPERQNFFAACLGLVPNQTSVPVAADPPVEVVNNAVVNDTDDEFKFRAPPPPTRNLRKVAARNPMVAFIKSNPIMPITSLRGQETMQKFKELKKPSWVAARPAYVPPAYEKDCRSRDTSEPACDAPICTPKKRKIKDDQYLHTYTFGTRQRIKRNVELVVGLSTKSFLAFNKCKPIGVVATRLDEKIVLDIQKRDEARRLLASKKIVRRFKNLEMKIILKDFYKFPDAIPQSLKKRIKINC